MIKFYQIWNTKIQKFKGLHSLIFINVLYGKVSVSNEPTKDLPHRFFTEEEDKQ